jgi:putative nucleotidyltransferase with HDIG domain
MKYLSAKEAKSDDRVLKIAGITDEFEGYKQPHAERIAAISEALARKLKFASHDFYSLRQAALIHDIGEVVMNREYIKTNRRLRESERVDMQRHTVIGEQEAAKRGLNRGVQLIVRWHHEWWNGAGYPDALAGEQIPLAPRILRLADTFSALTSERPYRAALSADEAKKYLNEWAGIEFDPKVVKMFFELESSEHLKTYADENTENTDEFSAYISETSG